MRTLRVLLWLVLLLPGISIVNATSHVPSAQLADGEVRKVDKEARKLTIRHGPIAHLEMPAMTMVFQVTDAAMLEAVKAGDRVRFNVEKIKGSFTVTHLEVVN